MTAPLVRATKIVKTFGPTTALKEVNLEVTAGRTHALVGRNGAGKSTLVSMLTGLAAPDSGSIEFGGEAAPPLSDRDAWRQRVACVYQKSTIIPHLSVAENLFLNRQALGRRFISWRDLRTRSGELLERWDIDVNPQTIAEDLTVEQRQMVEIARSLSFGARFIILDEPTAQLDGPAIRRLFDRIREFQQQGVTFLFISHHLSEVFEICEDVTVYRDAQHILTTTVDGLTQDALIEAMTGDAEAISFDRERGAASQRVMLASTGLTRDGEYRGIDLTVREGEIVGIAGSGGSGKIELAETLVGLRKASSGSVSVDGATVKAGSVRAALDAGIAFVPQDRHHEGFVPFMSVADNATLTVPRKIAPGGLIKPSLREKLAQGFIANLAIKTSGPEQSVDGLSGGNQQKVVTARALASDPRVLVLMSPTAGVDIKAKKVLLDVVGTAGDAGTAVLVVSDELDDLRGCDRVLVMFHGDITQEFARGWDDTALIAAMEGLA
ncbi:sugar ABC transporter ATP-binding protein [Micrococcales bacterium 31B]|nr:sugar ABC transporter ATP-binding protein [Micrococcales bacterium 31B]